MLAPEDVGRLPDHMVWTPEMVKLRLVEMVQTAQRSVKGDALGTVIAWPEYSHDWGEWVEQAGAGNLYDGKGRQLRRLYSNRHEVNRMEEALGWQARYLRGYIGPARVLRVWLACKAHRRKFRSAIKRRGWAESTAYRQRDKALSIIAYGLMTDGVKPQ